MIGVDVFRWRCRLDGFLHLHLFSLFSVCFGSLLLSLALLLLYEINEEKKHDSKERRTKIGRERKREKKK